MPNKNSDQLIAKYAQAQEELKNGRHETQFSCRTDLGKKIEKERNEESFASYYE